VTGSWIQIVKGQHVVGRIVDEAVKRSGAFQAEPEEGYVLPLLVPSMVVGQIIGKGGEKIKSIQSSTEAKIAVDKSGVSANMQRITIAGTAEQRAKAVYKILFLIGEKGDIPKGGAASRGKAQWVRWERWVRWARWRQCVLVLESVLLPVELVPSIRTAQRR